jgi:hypothetical protein
VHCTMSSSKPSDAVIFCSSHGTSTARLILCTSTFSEKLAGNLVCFRALSNALESETEAVPLISGIWLQAPAGGESPVTKKTVMRVLLPSALSEASVESRSL